MYMGVIPNLPFLMASSGCIPHVYGGDPILVLHQQHLDNVFPMYMGVILTPY